MEAFERAPHYLLDARLMIAWARALDERGETDKARFIAGAAEGIPQRAGGRVLRTLRRVGGAAASHAARPRPRQCAGRFRCERAAVPVPGAERTFRFDDFR